MELVHEDVRQWNADSFSHQADYRILRRYVQRRLVENAIVQHELLSYQLRDELLGFVVDELSVRLDNDAVSLSLRFARSVVRRIGLSFDEG